MTGIIEPGWGWEFVWWAYGVTVLFLGGYAASLLWRLRSEERRRDRDALRGGRP